MLEQLLEREDLRAFVTPEQLDELRKAERELYYLRGGLAIEEGKRDASRKLRAREDAERADRTARLNAMHTGTYKAGE
jgi:hypothetical protein